MSMICGVLARLARPRKPPGKTLLASGGRSANVRRMRLYVIRHADPDYERDSITPAGHLEARALAKRMQRERLDRIYCSPLGRAIATAQYTAELLNLRPVTEDWTCEVADCYFDDAPEGKVAAWDTPGELIRAAEPWPTHRDWARIDPHY